MRDSGQAWYMSMWFLMTMLVLNAVVGWVVGFGHREPARSQSSQAPATTVVVTSQGQPGQPGP